MMRQRAPKLLSLLALMLVGGVGSSADDSLAQRLDKLFQPLASPTSPGLAVLVRKGGETLFEHTYGIRDLRTRSNIDAQTNFRLASCTKQFTAMAVMLLVRDGKLRYDETLTEIFPDFPAYGKAITLRNLLNHTSGLPDYEDLMEAYEKSKGPTWSPKHQIQDDEVLSLLKKRRKENLPRERVGRTAILVM
jgi:CubicO group peptidase (beta-lactamase class C family)